MEAKKSPVLGASSKVSMMEFTQSHFNLNLMLSLFAISANSLAETFCLSERSWAKIFRHSLLAQALIILNSNMSVSKKRLECEVVSPTEIESFFCRGGNKQWLLLAVHRMAAVPPPTLLLKVLSLYASLIQQQPLPTQFYFSFPPYSRAMELIDVVRGLRWLLTLWKLGVAAMVRIMNKFNMGVEIAN